MPREPKTRRIRERAPSEAVGALAERAEVPEVDDDADLARDGQHRPAPPPHADDASETPAGRPPD